MRRVNTLMICILAALLIACPLCVIICSTFEYVFVLTSVGAFSILTAALSICILLFDLVFKEIVYNKFISVLMAIIFPLFMLNSVYLLVTEYSLTAIFSIMITGGCCLYMSIKYGRPIILKIVSLSLGAVMILPICIFCFFSAVFGNIGQDTVIKTVESPSGEYYAEVIDSDQGALGGDTVVTVRYKIQLDLKVIRIAKMPRRIYVGEWGEYNNMEIYWKNDTVLIINSEEFEID